MSVMDFRKKPAAAFRIVIALAVAVASETPASAALAVIGNATDEAVVATVHEDGQPPRPLELAAGESRVVAAAAQPRVQLPRAAAGQTMLLEPDCAYKIVHDDVRDSLRLARIPLGETPGRPWTAAEGREFAERDAGVIDVKIFVDDDELRARPAWEPALRQRLATASAHFESTAGVQFRIVAIDLWDSNDLELDFNRSLDEFEREASPGPAQLAIGFSSQYEIARGRVHMGGTRGALHSHILLKERAHNVLDTERLELLVHELGHFLGATHSGDRTSVMRPVVGQGQLRAAGARIRFDPPNALLMALLGQELRERGVRRLADVAPATRQRMGEIYTALAPSTPNDPATGAYLQLLNAGAADPLLDDVRRVLQHLVALAKLQRGAGAEALARDELLEFYVRQAALAAGRVRPENRQRAFVLALGFALDDGGLLRRAPIAGEVARRLETQQQRTQRLAAIGHPTMRGRSDLAKHFFVSATLVGIVGGEAARGAGLLKEMLDANGGSGFSFRDMAANRAGIVFAHAVLSGSLPLEEVARSFAVEEYLPPVDDLCEQMAAEEFFRDFGAVGDERLTAELARIEQRILALPAYQQADAATPTP
jgi:hypothetical protein